MIAHLAKDFVFLKRLLHHETLLKIFPGAFYSSKCLGERGKKLAKGVGFPTKTQTAINDWLISTDRKLPVRKQENDDSWMTASHECFIRFYWRLYILFSELERRKDSAGLIEDEPETEQTAEPIDKSGSEKELKSERTSESKSKSKKHHKSEKESKSKKSS